MISKIELKNFRNFSYYQTPITNKNVFIYGKNAVGKTSVLEALSLASITKSHRTNNLKEIIKDNEQYADIKVINDSNEYRVVLSKEGKMVSKNKVTIKKVSEYIGQLPTIFFSPYELSLINGSPATRRSFMNKEISQFDKLYLSNAMRYTEILNERNNCLKLDEIDETYLLVLDNQLSELGEQIIKKRQEFVNEINGLISIIQRKLNNNEIAKLVYKPSCEQNTMKDSLANHRDQDIKNRQTEIGPHRDELLFLLNNQEACKYASQGQIRSVVLSLMISLCYLYKNHTGNFPILLLDDVLSELDKERSNNLLHIIEEIGQTFITSVDNKLASAEALQNYQLINLEKEI